MNFSPSTTMTLRPAQHRQRPDRPLASSLWDVDPTSKRQSANGTSCPILLKRHSNNDVEAGRSTQLQLFDENGSPPTDANATFPRSKAEPSHPCLPTFPSAHLIHKNSGELLKPSLRARTKSAPSSPGSVGKAVHFDQQLEHVRLFRPRQTPLAVSRDGSPTETSEGETSDCFPFPGPVRLTSAPIQPLAPHIPWTFDVRLERIFLDGARSALSGCVLVRNIAYAKRVVARFTLDAWQTTSEVAAHYIASLRGGFFDRFEFRIRLADFRRGQVILCIKYTVDGKELWDNNNGRNYKVEFDRVGDDMVDLRTKLERAVKSPDPSPTPRKHRHAWLRSNTEADTDEDDDDESTSTIRLRSLSPSRDTKRNVPPAFSARHGSGKCLQRPASPSPQPVTPPSPQTSVRPPSFPPSSTISSKPKPVLNSTRSSDAEHEQRARHHTRSALEWGSSFSATVCRTPMTGFTPPAPSAKECDSPTSASSLSTPSISPHSPMHTLPKEDVLTPTQNTYHAFLDQFCFFKTPSREDVALRRAHSDSSVEDYFSSGSPPLGRVPASEQW